MGRLPLRRRRAGFCEALEFRTLLSAAADITQLTALRADENYAGVDGSGVGVAVIDSGVFAGRPDLQDNFVAWFDADTTPASAAPDTASAGENSEGPCRASGLRHDVWLLTFDAHLSSVPGSSSG